MNEHLQARFIEAQIDALIAAYPELAEDEELRADMLDGETDLRALLSRIVGKIREASAFVEAIKTQRDHLSDRQARYKRREEAMRSLAHRLMDAARTRKMELPEATLSVRAVPPSVQIVDENTIPDVYAKLVRQIDKAAVKDALKAGETVPGAALSNGGETLSVRLT